MPCSAINAIRIVGGEVLCPERSSAWICPPLEQLAEPRGLREVRDVLPVAVPAAKCMPKA
eukprot:9446789-Pyramimonas_sp.AAC.1